MTLRPSSTSRFSPDAYQPMTQFTNQQKPTPSGNNSTRAATHKLRPQRDNLSLPLSTQRLTIHADVFYVDFASLPEHRVGMILREDKRAVVLAGAPKRELMGIS
jgi:hypothetical protein